jgi:hypothetical protein
MAWRPAEMGKDAADAACLHDGKAYRKRMFEMADGP